MHDWTSAKQALLLPLALALTPVAAQAQPVAGAAEAAATPPAQTDPARLAAARIVVDHIFPAGTYARMMGAPMNKMMDSIMGGVGQVPLAELAAIGGMPVNDLARMNKATLDDIMAIYDPAYHDRMTLVMHTMMGEMGSLMSQVEPDIRDGMTQAYAAKFTADQLADMNRFFDTPSGQAYAANALLLQMDPAMMSRIQSFVPLMMKQLPTIAKKAQEATAALPQPRKWEDLTPAQRSRLAQLLGVTEPRLEANVKARKPNSGI